MTDSARYHRRKLLRLLVNRKAEASTTDLEKEVVVDALPARGSATHVLLPFARRLSTCGPLLLLVVQGLHQRLPCNQSNHEQNGQTEEGHEDICAQAQRRRWCGAALL